MLATRTAQGSLECLVAFDVEFEFDAEFDVTRCTVSPEREFFELFSLCWPGFDSKIKFGPSRSVYCQIFSFLRALVAQKMPKN